MERKNANAVRFIAAYNRLDQGLREIYSIKRTLTYSDMIRKVANVNTVVSKFEEDLIDYGRLRNAIVHKSSDEIIAEPNIDVVEKLVGNGKDKKGLYDDIYSILSPKLDQTEQKTLKFI